MKAIAHVKRKGEDITTSEYTAADAKTAGLWNKSGPWSLHPKRMLTMKARNFALRAAFADLFLGLEYSAEELMEVAESKSIKPSPVNTPKDITPEIQEILDTPRGEGAIYAVDNKWITGMELNTIINEKIDSIMTREDMENYELWRSENFATIKDFCKHNKAVCLEFKDAIDYKRNILSGN